MRRHFPFVIAAAIATLFASAAAARHPRETQAGTYDYYVMALSWSPTWCRTHPDEDDQCAHKGYGFVLHGLWPQYERGGGPERCSTREDPDRKTVARTLAFMPSRRLIRHEWRAHGACTGLDPDAYFELADHAFAAVRVPSRLAAPRDTLTMTADQLRAAFRGANPGLRDDMMSLHCSRGELVEVRVCLDKSLSPRDCGRGTRSRCPAKATFEIPSTR